MQGRCRRLLLLGLAFTTALLLAGLTPELTLLLTQAVLLLPGLVPALIQERQAQGQHRVDVLGSRVACLPL